MEYREQKTPEEIRAMPPGEFLDWLKKPCGPRDDHAPTTPRVMGEGQKKAHNPPKTRTPILISAMRLLARDIQSDDGVANAAIAEAADRLEELDGGLCVAQARIKALEMQVPGYAELERDRIIGVLLSDKAQVWLPEAGDLYPATANDLRKLLQP